MVGLRDGELVYDGDISDVSDETFREIYGRAITPDDIMEIKG
jgi:phosphonate transport system ATP-binding protein